MMLQPTCIAAKYVKKEKHAETLVLAGVIPVTNLLVVHVMVKTQSLPEDFEELEVVGEFSL